MKTWQQIFISLLRWPFFFSPHDTSGIFFSSYLCLLVFDQILKWLLDIVNCDYYWPGRCKPLLWQIASVFRCGSAACYSAEHLKVLPLHRVTALLEKSLITLNDGGVINHLLVQDAKKYRGFFCLSCSSLLGIPVSSCNAIGRKGRKLLRYRHSVGLYTVPV